MRIPLKGADDRMAVTDAGRDSLALRALVRRAIPMLDRPEQYAAHERRQLAQTLTAALEVGASPDDGDTLPQEYEPGCLSETPLP